MIFQSYVSDKGLSSHYWNDNSSFPQSRGGVGEWGITSPHRPSPLFFLHTYPLSLSTWMLESPWCFPDALAQRAHWQKPTSPLPIALTCSLPVLHAHTHSLSPAAHCLVKETLPWPSRLPGYNPIKQWLTLWTHGLLPLQNGKMVSVGAYVCVLCKFKHHPRCTL